MKKITDFDKKIDEMLLQSYTRQEKLQQKIKSIESIIMYIIMLWFIIIGVSLLLLILIRMG